MKDLTSKKLEFRTRLTGKVLALSALPLACACLLGFFAHDAWQKFSPNDATRIPFVGIPFLLALMLVVSVALTLNHFLNREIVIEGEYLVYRDAKNELHLEIAKMAYSPPGEQSFFKMLMFSDGETFVQIPEMFLGSQPFAQLSELLSGSRRKSRSAPRDTYSL